MLQNACKTLGFKKNIIYKIPPGVGGGKPYPASGLQVLVLITRHKLTMNLVEEKQRRLIPPGLQSWPLQLIEHLANTTSVAPPSCRSSRLTSSVPSPLGESEFYNMGSKRVLHTPV